MERPKLKNYFEKLEGLWTKEKPKYACIFLTRIKYKKEFSYNIWTFEWVKNEFDDDYYLGWIDQDGDEFDDYNECIADGYLVLELLPTKEEVKYGVRYE